jgi:hypothetical protein
MKKNLYRAMIGAIGLIGVLTAGTAFAQDYSDSSAEAEKATVQKSDTQYLASISNLSQADLLMKLGEKTSEVTAVCGYDAVNWSFQHGLALIPATISSAGFTDDAFQTSTSMSICARAVRAVGALKHSLSKNISSPGAQQASNSEKPSYPDSQSQVPAVVPHVGGDAI